MKSEEIRRVVSEVLDELIKRDMLRPSDKIAYSNVSDRLYDFYEAGAKDYDVQTALKELESDPYYMLIPLYFSELKTIDQLAEIFGVEVSTITRNKKRLCLAIYNTLSHL